MRRKICLGVLGLSICLWVNMLHGLEAYATEAKDVFSVDEMLTESQGDEIEQEEVIENRKIRVGWFENEGYYEKDRNGNLIGFGMDYLKAIASYTGWEYEFVEGTREECLTMLQSGAVDIMSPIRIDMELENARMSNEVIGESYGYIYKLGNNFRISYLIPFCTATWQ